MQIIGYGGFGRELEAYMDDLAHVAQIFKDNECAKLKCAGNRDAVISIGDEEIRARIAEEMPGQCWGVINLGKAYGNCYIGEGCIICPNTILTTNVTLGRHCLVNISCTIGHDVTIGDFVTINPGVNISGNVIIGSNCNIGSNAVIRNGIHVCDDVIIGAGSVVVKDITEPGIYVGSPAVRLDKRPSYATKEQVIKLQDQVLNILESGVAKATDTVSIRMSNKNKKE